MRLTLDKFSSPLVTTDVIDGDVKFPLLVNGISNPVGSIADDAGVAAVVAINESDDDVTAAAAVAKVDDGTEL